MAELPEIVFASSDPVQSRKITGWIEEGILRPLIPRAYTSNLLDEPSVITRKNIWHLLSNLFPGFLISHRTALEYQISPKGNIYLTASARRVYRWPGVNIRIAEGLEPLETDTAYYGTLYASSIERACLENLSSSRIIEGEKRTVGQEVIERRLLDILNTRGEDTLNALRDHAREIAGVLNMPKEFDRLDHIIGSLLSTKPSRHLKSQVATAYALGEPYDSGRIELFNILAAELRARVFAQYPEKTRKQTLFSHFAFFESYFSNYIEGTTFPVEEALDIVYHEKMIPLRTEDTHDIRGTFRICADRKEMQIIPSSAEDLILILRRRHAAILSGRPDKYPGAFKSKTNRAGDTVFVEPQFVIGTLKMGFKSYYALEDPVARALFMMFLVSEVHPFADGNGRIARIMMNAELVHHGYTKIIIPTVYRDDYMLALRKLTRQSDSVVYVRMMLRALEFSHWLDPDSIDRLRGQLEQSNAFKEPDADVSVLRWNENPKA